MQYVVIHGMTALIWDESNLPLQTRERQRHVRICHEYSAWERHPKQGKIDQDFLFVVKLLFFISDAPSVYNKAGGERGFDSWTRTYALGKKLDWTLSKISCKTLIYDDSNGPKKDFINLVKFWLIECFWQGLHE